MDIKALQWELAAFVVDRGLDPLHTPKNLSMALAAEAGALLALFKWSAGDADQAVSRPESREAAADAIADAVLHAVHLADRLGIDLDEAIRRKLAKNAARYPMSAEPERGAAPPPRVEPVVERERKPVELRAHNAAAAEPAPRVAARPAASPPRETPPPPRKAPVPPARRASPLRVDGPPTRTPSPPRAVRSAAPEPPPSPKQVAPPEEDEVRYPNLDPEAARTLVAALVKRADRTRSDDPLLRELYDELTTLKRTLYAENPKRAWLTGGLQSIRRLLEEAATHSVGDELKASEYLAEVERILRR